MEMGVTRQTVYKVVRMHSVGDRVTLMSVTRNMATVYQEDQWAVGRYNTPLMCFDNLEDARTFMTKMESADCLIYLAEAEVYDTKPEFLLRPARMKQSAIRRFWKYWNIEERTNQFTYTYLKTPPGTIVCKRVKLLQEVV